MIYIRNYNLCSDVRQYELQSNKMLSVKDGGLRKNNIDIDGLFSKFNGNIVILYRQNKRLYLSIKEQNHLFTDLQIKTSDVQRTIEQGFIIKQIRHIVITDRFGNVVLSTDYNEISDTFVDDWTPMIEDDDFDFGLFLENVSRNIERQKRLFSGIFEQCLCPCPKPLESDSDSETNVEN